MDITIEHRPSYAIARVTLSPGESIKAESGAMVAMRGDIGMQTASGGVMKGLKRALMGGESFFQNTFTAQNAGGVVWLAPALPGDILSTPLKQPLIVQDGSYLASAAGIEVDTRWQGARGFFSGEGFVMLRVAGEGPLILSSYGAIMEHELRPGESMAIDSGHLVAFTEGTEYRTERVTRGVKSFLFSGEGIVSRFEGPGRIWTQSRSSQNFLDWLARRIPGGGGSGGGRGFLGGVLGE